MDRKQLQLMAKERQKDAKALLGRKRWSAAYYFSGDVIECARKARLLRHLGESDALYGNSTYRKEIQKCWTHDLQGLMILGGLKTTFETARLGNPLLNQFWTTVSAWDETSRYQSKTETQAKELYEAICNKPDGVFKWIQLHW